MKVKTFILFQINLIYFNYVDGSGCRSRSRSRSLSSSSSGACNKPKPNIVIIFADDLGINDLSFYGSNQIITPNIDALAYNGIILHRHYTPNLCTPSRATLLTGKYPIHTGTQHFAILNDEPWGLPMNEKIMPEILRNAGYSTSLVGKWHLGFSKKSYTPTLRGFDYHYGYYGGFIDYYNYSFVFPDDRYPSGYDFRKNLKIDYNSKGAYATDLFTDEAIRLIHNNNRTKPMFLMLSHLAVHTANDYEPLQAPINEIHKFSHIANLNRRKYAAMVSKLDESVGRVMEALKTTGMLDNTIVLFSSDNGAPTKGIFANGGSNYPLRGQKESPWEGGIRVPSVLYSPLLKSQQRVYEQVLYSADWLPTLASAACIKLPKSLKVDGRDMWNFISNNKLTNRNIMHNIDEIFHYSMYMKGNYKYINGSTVKGNYDKWLGQQPKEDDPRSKNYSNTILKSKVGALLQNHALNANKIEILRHLTKIQCPKISNTSIVLKCSPLVEPCLFDVFKDPCEYYNLAKIYPEKLIELQKDVELYRKTAVPPARIAFNDPRSNPALHNYTWTWWQQESSNFHCNKSQQPCYYSS